MIYASALNVPVKKAYGDKCYSTTVAKIIEQMSIDPAVSGMNACVLGARDVQGINRQKVNQALHKKHPDVCVVYLYQKEKEEELLDTPFKKIIKKVTPDAVKEAVDSYIDEHLLGEGKAVISRDSRAAKPITSKPVDRALPQGAAKGKLAKSAATASKRESKKSDEVEVQYDAALELYYFLDPLGKMVYCDPKTKKPLSPAQVQAQKDRIASDLGGKPKTRRVPRTKTEDKPDAVSDDPFADVLAGIGDMEGGEEFTAGGEGGEDLSSEGMEIPPAPTGFTPAPTTTGREVHSMEDNIASIRDFHDWGVLKEALQRDNAVRQLLEENSSFAGCVQMMSVLDEEIKQVYYDVGLTSEQKFERILEIGGRRSTLAATHNDILAKKVLSIMEAITISARRTVEEVLLDHRRAMEQITVSEKDIMSEKKLGELLTKRTEAEFELLALIKSIITLYQAMDVEVNDVILSLDKKLPSDNEFINQMVGSAGDILTPTNTTEIAKAMMQALQSNRAQFSLLQDSVMKVIGAIHNIIKKDSAIIEHQQHMIKMLKAHRVEDAVVLDGVLKSILHVYVGTYDVGTTATTLTWSGCLSRRRNTLLVNLMENNKLHGYGVEPVMLDDFLRERIERPLCVVEGAIKDSENLMEVIRELKTRLDYYAHVNVVCSAEDIETIKVLAAEALTLNFITNCTTSSMEDIALAYKAVQVDNVARKLILIDPPIDVLALANRMKVDVTTTKCVTIPNLPKVKMCGVVLEKPYEYQEVRMAFEEAFR